jgi:hypothetical protein
MNSVRLRLLEREISHLSRLAVETAEELEQCDAAGRRHEGPDLAQGIAHLALTISYLLWRFGRRVTDKYAAEEADVLRERLGLDDDSPLAPHALAPLAELLVMSPADLHAAVDPALPTVTVNGVTRSLRPVTEQLSRIQAALAVPADEAVGTA